MSYEHKPNSGSLWPNDRKTAENQPNMTGELCLPDGTVVRIAAWSKTAKNAGKQFLSLKLSPITRNDKPREVEPLDMKNDDAAIDPDLGF